jgi:GIY-YIG catalytic domain-containing protein
MASRRSGVQIPSAPPILMAFYVYILQSEATGRYYVGQTKNLQERVAYHHANYSKALLALRRASDTGSRGEK